ncbi:MAG: thiamine pyrophosphate-binding protein [Armatimonadetes bacterium]|nr:thiamine pyrophosphate-binding protein [Armatimonadota bacterium]
MTGAELFAAELRRQGVSWISTLCGNGLNSILAGCRRAGIRLVDTRNEQAAAYMAEGWGRLTRQVGVCAVSSGVAHANALTGVLNAHFDGAPMLLVTGAGPVRTAGSGHFQDLDHVALAAPLCKYARQIDVPERIPEFVAQAFAAALSGRPGPVHLTFPMDVQDAVVDEARLPRPAAPAACTRMAPEPGLLAEAGALLARAERPLIVAGSGAYYADAAAALERFVAAHDVPVAVPIWDRGAVPHALPQFMGVLGAASGGPRLLADADLLLLLGAACDYRVGGLQPPAVSPDARILRVDVDPTRLHTGPADLAIPADPRSFLEALEPISLPRYDAWLAEAQRRRREFRARVAAAAPRERLHAVHILEALQETLSEDAVFLIDGGSIGQWYHQLLCDRYPGHNLTCGASAVIGYGIPGAMAARLAYPDRPVVLLSGDGSMTFTLAELECAARQRLPFVAIVADDQAWGIVAVAHQEVYGEPLASRLGPLRFDLVAEGFGARGVRVSRPEEIAPAIREALSADLPTVIHVPIAGGFPSAG